MSWLRGAIVYLPCRSVNSQHPTKRSNLDRNLAREAIRSELKRHRLKAKLANLGWLYTLPRTCPCHHQWKWKLSFPTTFGSVGMGLWTGSLFPGFFGLKIEGQKEVARIFFPDVWRLFEFLLSRCSGWTSTQKLIQAYTKPSCNVFFVIFFPWFPS